MKWIKPTCSTLVLCVMVTSVQAAPVIEKPDVIPEIMVSITVPDLHGFIDEASAVVAQASPMMNGAMIKSMIGMQLGDPNLSGIGQGKGFSIVALDLTNIFAVVEIEAGQSTNYVNMAKTKGLQAQYENGALVLSRTPGALAKGTAMVDPVRNSLLGRRSSAVRIALQPSAIIEHNKAAIEGLMKTLSGSVGQSMMQQPGATLDSAQSTMKILEGELKVVLSLASQCAVAEVVLAPKSGAIQISETFVPKEGTDLAKLVNAPKIFQEDAKIHSGLFNGGTVLFDFHIANSEALAAFVAVEAEKLLKDMEIENVDLTELVANMKKWTKIYGGTGCEQVSLGADGKMEVSYVMEVKDETATLDMLRSMEKDIAPFLKLYESFGMPMSMSFKENAREANGINIHEFTVSIDAGPMPPEQRDQMKMMGLENMTYEIAITEGLMYYSSPGGMEALIQRFKDPATKGDMIKARSVYPSGGFYYFDLDMGGYMAFASLMIPDAAQNPMMKQQMATLFQGVEPIASAGFKEEGCVMWSVNIPGELIAKFGQMAMMAQMQQMQSGGAPQGMPDGAPQTVPAQ